MSIVPNRRVFLLGLLTLACLAGAASLGLLSPEPAYAQACPNGGCEGIYCRYFPTFSCSFPDRNSCTTRKCAFIVDDRERPT